MADCKDQNMEKLLYSYELGMLDRQQEEQVELHLMECEDCFGRSKRFRKAASLIKSDSEIKLVIRDLALSDQGKSGSKIPAHEAEPSYQMRWSNWKRYAVAVAAVLVILLLRPWNLQFRSTQEALAVENRLIVPYFRNLADSLDTNRASDIATNLLITDLSQIHGLQVVTAQHLYDIVKQLGHEGGRWIEPDDAPQIAEKSYARWMLTGDILSGDERLILTAQLSDVAAGVIITSYRIDASSKSSIFDLVDSFSVLIRNDLEIPDAIPNQSDLEVSHLTTRSAEAYRFYLEGVENYNRYYYPEAERNFGAALQVDSSIAMAYYYLSIIDEPDLINSAMKNISHAARIDQALIRSRAAALTGDVASAKAELLELLRSYPENKEALFRLGEFAQRYEHSHEEALHYFRRVLELDSLHHLSYNRLAYAYMAIGSCGKATWAVNKYVSYAPDDANPYDTRGEIYANCGDLSRAIESYRQALQVKPDFSPSLLSLGVLYAFSGDYIRADSCFQANIIPGCCLNESSQHLYSAVVPMLQGKINEAVTRLDDALEVAIADSCGEDPYRIHQLKALLNSERGRYDEAFTDLEAARKVAVRLDSTNIVNTRPFLIQLLAESGRLDEAADSLESLRSDVGEDDRLQPALWYAEGSLLLAGGDGVGAVAEFERLAELAEGIAPDIIVGSMLARSYLEAGMYDNAAVTLEKQLSRYTKRRALVGTWSARLHYYLGLAYEHSGNGGDATEHYEAFLNLWKDADSDIYTVMNAKVRLKRLRSQS
jgi:tetratricopeptide (TPR) repeat protein